jgi:NAD(P)-dependent dehydrogenase (short-subunit alcohol dehydrogenase family)
VKTTTDLFNLQDKVALVTGATRGIGLACAELLAAKGATVIISSRKQEACEQIAAQFQADGLKAVPMACHLGEMDAVPTN